MHYKVNRLSQSFWDYCRQEQPLGDAQEILDYYSMVGPDFRGLQPRLRTDVFGAEGYLSILVGQKTPYKGKIGCRLHNWNIGTSGNAILKIEGRTGLGWRNTSQASAKGTSTSPLLAQV